MLARMRANVSTRTAVIAIVAGALALTGCSSRPETKVEGGSGKRFIAQVVDSADDVGRGNSVTVAPDGSPMLSYWGFPGKLEEGQVAAARPIGSPFIPAVQLSSLTDGIWNRGAAAQGGTNNSGVPVSFNPPTVESMDQCDDTKPWECGVTPENTNGTDIAVSEGGKVGIAWTGPDGVWFAERSNTDPGPTAGSFKVTEVYPIAPKLEQAGPVGPPSVVYAGETAWVTFISNQGREEVIAAQLVGEKWQRQIVAELQQCDCPQPGAAPIGVFNGKAVIAYTDYAAKAVKLATLGGETKTIATDVTGGGLAMSTTGSDVMVSYYKGDGTVEVASGSGQPFRFANSQGSADSTSVIQQTTGIAVDPQGVIYVGWYDAADDQVHLGSLATMGGTVEEIETNNTQHGSHPSLAISPEDQLVYMSWYVEEVPGAGDSQAEPIGDLYLGTYGDQSEQAFANPSPTPKVQTVDTGAKTCEDTKTVALDEVAKGIAFLNTVLCAPAGQNFEIAFDNQDAGVMHNVALFADSAHTQDIMVGDIISGVAQTTYPVDALDAGEYYFVCSVHPTMAGRLVSIAGAKPAKA